MKRKKIIPLTNEEKSFMKSKKFVIYVKKNFVPMKKNLNKKKLKIIVTIQDNIEELLIVFVIYAIKYQKILL